MNVSILFLYFNDIRSGMSFVNQKMGNYPLALHNRYFSPDNDYYVKMGYPFIVESFTAIPTSQAVYDYMMGKAKQWYIYILGSIISY